MSVYLRRLAFGVFGAFVDCLLSSEVEKIRIPVADS